MSRGINKVILIGNLGADPEMRYTQNSTAIANLSIATSESWKDKQTGEQREQTEWHRVVMYRRLAEIAGEYLKKGSKVYIEGKLQTRKWQGQDGQDRYTTEVVANELQMLDGRSGGGGNYGGGQQPSAPQTQSAPQGGYGGGQQGGGQQQGGYGQQQGGYGGQHQQQQPQQGGYGGQQQQPAPQQPAAPKPQPMAPEADFDDDIPF